MSEASQHPELDAAFWETRYQDGTDRWDLDQPAPPLVSLLDRGDSPEPGRIHDLEGYFESVAQQRFQNNNTHCFRPEKEGYTNQT